MCESHSNPHATLYVCSTSNEAVLIINYGGGGYFTINNLQGNDLNHALYCLISAYYVFDFHYPSYYGLLKLIDTHCILDEVLSSNAKNITAIKKQTKKGKSKKASKTTLQVKYENFVSKLISFTSSRLLSSETFVEEAEIFSLEMSEDTSASDCS